MELVGTVLVADGWMTIPIDIAALRIKIGTGSTNETATMTRTVTEIAVAMTVVALAMAMIVMGLIEAVSVATIEDAGRSNPGATVRAIAAVIAATVVTTTAEREMTGETMTADGQTMTADAAAAVGGGSM